MKRILALLTAALITISLAGCSSPDDPYVPTGGGLTWDDPTEGPGYTLPDRTEQELITVYAPAENYNPYFSTDPTNRSWMSLLYQGLFAVDSDYEAHPILCDSYWMSEDMTTYVFYIRSGVTFSDGTALTVADVLASLQYAMESEMYRGRFTKVISITATAGSSITVTLSTPYENFPILLDVPILKQAELTADRPAGTGPYRMDAATAGMRLVRVSNWWSDAQLPVNASAITLNVAESPLQVRDDFELADVDLVCADPGAYDYAAYRCDYELWDSENGEFLYLGVNMSSWIFGNDTIRWALTHAIDREAISEEFYHGFARAATLPASPLSPYYDSVLAAQYGYDPEVFNQAVLEADLAGSTVRLLVNGADQQRVRIANRIAEMLEASGLVVEIVQYSDLNDYRYTLTIGNYDLHLGETKLSANMDLSAFFADNGALNFGGIANARFYALCLDSLANQGNYYNLHKEIADDGRLVPILFGTYAVYGERGVVTDLRPSRDNVFYYDLGLSLEDVLLDQRRTDAPAPEPTEAPTEPEPTE